MKRALTIWLLLGACGPARVATPVPADDRNSTGAWIAAFDPAQVDAWLASHELPAASPPLDRIEGGRARSLVEAMSAVDEDPSPLALGTLGTFLHALDRSEAADACYSVAASGEPEEARWPHYRGDIAEQRGDQRDAVAHFEESCRRDPGAVPSAMRLARAHVRLGAGAESREHLERLMELAPDSLFALTELARLCLDEGDTTRARDLTQRALNAWPRQRQPLAIAARIARQEGRDEEARDLERRAELALPLGILTLDPWMAELEARTNSLLYWKTLVEELQRTARWSELLGAVREVQRREPGPVWQAKEAQALLYLGRVEEGLRVARDLQERYPALPHGHEVAGLGHLASGRLEAATASSASALAIDPRSPLGHEVQIKARLARREADAAMAAVRLFRDIAPTEPGPIALGLLVHRSLASDSQEAGRMAEVEMHLAAVEELLLAGRALAPRDPRWVEAARWLGAMHSALR